MRFLKRIMNVLCSVGRALGFRGQGRLLGTAEYTTPGSYSWTAPWGVTQVSVVCVGGGGNGDGTSGGGGGGGGYGTKVVSVTPGNSYDIAVGGAGGDSYFKDASTVAGLAGQHGSGTSGGAGGAGVGTTTASGAAGGDGSTTYGSDPGDGRITNLLAGGSGGASGSGGAGGFRGEVYDDRSLDSYSYGLYCWDQYREFAAGNGGSYGGGGGGGRSGTIYQWIDGNPPTREYKAYSAASGAGASGRVYLSW